MFSKVIKKAQEAAADRTIEVNKLMEIRQKLNEYELDVYGNMIENRDEYYINLIRGSFKFLFNQKDIKNASKLRVV